MNSPIEYDKMTCSDCGAKYVKHAPPTHVKWERGFSPKVPCMAIDFECESGALHCDSGLIPLMTGMLCYERQIRALCRERDDVHNRFKDRFNTKDGVALCNIVDWVYIIDEDGYVCEGRIVQRQGIGREKIWMVEYYKEDDICKDDELYIEVRYSYSTREKAYQNRIGLSHEK